MQIIYYYDLVTAYPCRFEYRFILLHSTVCVNLPLVAITVTSPMIQLYVTGIFSRSFIMPVNAIGVLLSNKKGCDGLIHPSCSNHIRELRHMAVNTLEQS